MAVLQPYQTGEIRDIFTEISQENLIELLNNNLELKNKFINFTKQTLKHAESTQETLDLLGDKNLSIILNEDEDKFVILDPHHIYKTSDKEHDCGARCQQRLDYLKDILEKIL